MPSDMIGQLVVLCLLKGGVIETRTFRMHAYGDRPRRLLFLWAKDSRSRLRKDYS